MCIGMANSSSFASQVLRTHTAVSFDVTFFPFKVFDFGQLLYIMVIPECLRRLMLRGLLS